MQRSGSAGRDTRPASVELYSPQDQEIQSWNIGRTTEKRNERRDFSESA